MKVEGKGRRGGSVGEKEKETKLERGKKGRYKSN